MTVLVTDVDHRVGLYAAQACGRLGHRVIGTGGTPSSSAAGAHSRWVAEYVACAHEDLPGLVGARPDLEAVLPVSVNACFALARSGRDQARRPHMLAAGRESLERVNDKLAVVDAARRAGLGAPRTAVVAGGEDPGEAAVRMGLPAVVKLRNDRGWYLAPQDRYRIVRTRADAREAERAFPAGAPLLVQEYVKGRGACVAVLRDARGRLHASVAYRRRREYPVKGGPSSCAETVADGGLVSDALRLLDVLEFGPGVAHVEFKVRGSAHEIMEVNPRLWGTVRLAEYAGAPFIARWLAMENGEAPPERPVARAGVRIRSWATDLAGMPGYLRAGRFREVAEFFADAFNPRIKAMIWDWQDPAACWRLFR